MRCTVVVRGDLPPQEVRGYIGRIGRVLEVEEVIEAGERPRKPSDLFVVIGGDGTLLWAVRVADGLPVVGFKKGRIGFLATFKLEEIEEVLNDIKTGKLKPSERTRINTLGYNALNEISINSTAARMIEVEFKVDSQREISFRGDGLIVATPTGSTAYNLAAGGPIVLPDIPAYVITPIAPHTLSLRSIVISSDYEVRVKVRFRHTNPPLLSADGIPIKSLKDGEEITIRKGKPALIYTTPDFFSNLFEHLSNP